jgi:hypothetical protein
MLPPRGPSSQPAPAGRQCVSESHVTGQDGSSQKKRTGWFFFFFATTGWFVSCSIFLMTNHRVFTFQTNKARPAAVSVQQIATRLHECGCFCLSTDAGCSYICDCEHNAQRWEKKSHAYWMQSAAVHTCLGFFPRVHLQRSNGACLRKSPARSGRPDARRGFDAQTLCGD